MRILLASIAMTGHLNPLLSIGRILIAEGHEVVGLSGSVMRGRIEGIGAEFRPFPAGADKDLRILDLAFPERKAVPPEQTLAFDLEHAFIDPIPAQHEGLHQVLQEFPADIIIAEQGLFGIFPMLLGPRSKRPAVIICGTTWLPWRRDDGAPIGAGFSPAESEAEREKYAAIAKEGEAIFAPIAGHLNERLEEAGAGPLSMSIFDAMVKLPDAYLQLTVPGFEFPRRDMPASVHFIGALPITANQAPVPSWAHELDGSRKVVLVTQGTQSNHDFGQLIAPTLSALANEPDLLVVVTGGGRSTGAIPGPIPENARLADYLPFEWLLPKIDAFVTNGGYGSVNQALSFGIPIVAAGLSEDKADVNVRVAWSGVGIDLRTDKPAPLTLREAIRAVLDKPDYRSRALYLAKELGRIDTRSEVLRIISQVSGKSAKAGAGM